MTFRLELASLLAGFDVETLRRERDEAIDLLDGIPLYEHNNERRHTFAVKVYAFLDRLPVGAVGAARERLAKR